MEENRSKQHKKGFRLDKSSMIWIAALMIGGSIWLWEEVIEDRVIPKRFGVVQQGSIYRSGQLSAALVRKTLAKYKIEVIVSLSGEAMDDPDMNAERQAAADMGIKRVCFPLKGNGTGDIKNYAGAISAICQAQKQGKTVLVHCAAGSQRTGGAIAIYRIFVEKKDTSFAIAEMIEYGWKAKSNPYLLPYLNENMSELATLLKEMGVITEIPQPLPKLKTKTDKGYSSIVPRPSPLMPCRIYS